MPEQPGVSTTLDGERKTVTALFADIKGSTELMEDLDPEDARAIIDPALKLMIAAVQRYDGYVVQSTGDGIFALFGAPVAHEDHPQRAVHAALAARDDLRRRSHDSRRQGRIGVEMRIGINTGEVVMRSVQTGGHTEYSPVGHAINLASRMQSAAPADGVVVSAETQRLVEGYFELRGLGPTVVKGVAEPIEVYEVVAPGASRGHFDLAARRGLTRFVGREGELEQIRRALERATSEQGQIVAVMAEAGTGKSRLFYEFQATIPAECKVLEAYSVSHGKASAWLPVLELLRKYFGIADSDDAATRRENVNTALSTLDPTLSDATPYLFGLLGIVEGPDPLAQMDPQIKRQRTLEAIKRIFLRESLKQPLVAIFEDLHWIDEQTQALLDLLADSVGNARVLLLVNYRPEYSHQWGSKSHYVQIGLNPLMGDNAAAMLAALLGEGIELNPLKRLITQRTGGNPFFIEETVQTLFDEGALVRNGVVKVTRSLSQLRLPPTVQGILAARIDRLSPEQKELLQMLAVIGRESPLELIRQMSAASEPQLERMLRELRAAEFIYEQPAMADTEFVFKHALTQEVAYNSLLIERRKLLHERAGQALESMFADQLEDHLAQLAHHYRYSDNLDKAVEYLGRAGQQAMQRSAYADAILSLTATIDLLPKLPIGPERMQKELQTQLGLGRSFTAIRGWAALEVERAYTRAREICQLLGDPPDSFFVLYGLWAMYHVRGEFRTSRELADDLLRRAQSITVPAMLVLAHNSLGQTSYHTGELIFARHHQEISANLYNPVRDGPLAFMIGVDPAIGVMSYGAHTLWNLGYPDQALRKGHEALALAETTSHPFTVAFAKMFLGFIHQFRREALASQEISEGLIATCKEQGFTLLSAFATGMHGVAMIQRGRYEEGIAEVRERLTTALAAGAGIGRTDTLHILAEALGKTDRLDDSLSVLAEAGALAENNEDRTVEPEIYRVKGDLLLKKDDSNLVEAQTCFQKAIEIARKQSGKSLELRATMSLARLLDKQGRRDEARTILADIYGWFTEGFHTADLIDAKALLDELGA